LMDVTQSTAVLTASKGDRQEMAEVRRVPEMVAACALTRSFTRGYSVLGGSKAAWIMDRAVRRQNVTTWHTRWGVNSILPSGRPRNAAMTAASAAGMEWASLCIWER